MESYVYKNQTLSTSSGSGLMEGAVPLMYSKKRGV